MAVNLDLFHFQLSDLAVSRYWLSFGIKVIKERGAFRGFLVASSGIPGPPEEEGLGRKARGEARTERRVREMLLRLSYVFGWSCLEDLLLSCVREVLSAQPQRILDIGNWWRDGDLVRKQVLEGWSREQVVAELVRLAVENFEKQPFPEVPRYFKKRLEVAWQARWEQSLMAIAKRRNSAAHEVSFGSYTDDFVEKDLRQILECGEAIARACAKRHGVSLISETVDGIRAGPDAE